MRNNFLYFIQDEQKRFFKKTPAGIVLGSDPRPLKYSPDGWQQLSIQNIRNKKYFGIDRAITIPINFVEDGAEIIKHIMYTYGANYKCYLSILELNLEITATNYSYWHKKLVELEIDLLTFNHAEFKVSCTLLEDGIVKYIKANENTVYEIPLQNQQKINDDGVFIQSKVEMLTNDGYAPGSYQNDNHLAGIDLIFSEPTNIAGVKGQVRQKVANNNTTIHATNNWFYKAQSTGSVTANYSFPITTTFNSGSGITPGPTAAYSIQIRHLNSTGGLITTYPLFQITAGQSFNRSVRVIGSKAINISIGDELYLYSVFTSASASPALMSTVYNVDGDFFFNLSFRYRKAPTQIDAVTPAYVFEYLINKITDGKFQTDTTGFLNTEKNKMFTSIDGIRGIPKSVLKISLSIFFEFFDTWRDAGMYLTPAGKVKMARKVDMVDYSNVIDLGQISAPVIEYANEFPFSVLKIGYPDKDVEGVNGKQAFNNIFEYSYKGARSTNVLDKVCKVIADPFYQEIVRITYEGQNTTDSKFDNDVCVMHVNDFPNAQGSFDLYRVENATATGLLEATTIYNLSIRPTVCLRNNGEYLKSILNNGILSFTTSSKNSNVKADSVEYNFNTIIDKDDVVVSTLKNGYFKPFYLNVESAGLDGLLETVKQNPLSVFSFKINNDRFVGIADKILVEPSTRKSQVYKLLCGKDTDLTKLITFNG